MKTIIEQLESEIPHGNWCNQGGKEKWCPYFEIRKPTLSDEGSIQSYFCNLSEEFVTRKECEINEEPKP